jgi:anti-anti-sigma factor
MVGVALSMAVFLYKSMRPVVAELSLCDHGDLCSAEAHHLQGCRHIAVVRFDGALFFANASYLDEQVAKFRTKHPDLRYILLDSRGINDMDASGEEAVEKLVARVRSAKIGFAMSSVKGQVMDVMDRTGLTNKIGEENFYSNTTDAITAISKQIHTDTDLPADGCDDCPLTKFLPSK